MNIVEKCETPGCEENAEHITSTETKFIQVCKNCYNKKYRT